MPLQPGVGAFAFMGYHHGMFANHSAVWWSVFLALVSAGSALLGGLLGGAFAGVYQMEHLC
jgi:hypothetical protein